MKVWSAVYMYCGIISDIQVFFTKEAASRYFFDIVNDKGGINACDPDYYEDGNGSDETFYWFDGDENKITIWKCVVDY